MAEKEAGKQACPRAPPPFPPPNCPRCYSGNTKFCYYNNYSVLQPRYLCKTCRRYWTHGGVLRNIPSGGIRRKRVRNDSSSSSSQIPKPPPSVLSIRSAQNHASVGGGSSHGVGAFKPEFMQNMRSFNNDGFFYRPPSRLNPNSAFLGGANAGFDAVNVAFGVGVTPQPASLTVTLPQLSSLNGLGGFNVPFVQQSLQHQPPTAWTGQNTGHTSILPDDFLAMARDVAATANEVNIDEWSELLDMDHVGDPHQSCKPPSP